MLKIFKLFMLLAMIMVSLSGKEIKGNYELYYLTTDEKSLFSNENSLGGFALNINYQHKFMKNKFLNISLTGYNDFGENIGGSLEPFNFKKNISFSSYFNILNFTYIGKYFKYTLGRQLLNTPMLGSIDMYLNPSSFEAYTIESGAKNKNWSFLMTYIDKVRPVASGSNFDKLSGHNYAIGMKYELNNKSNVWFYNIDSKQYKQFYIDYKKYFFSLSVGAQYIYTDYMQKINSNAYGIQLSFNKLPLNLNLSYNNVLKNRVGHLEIDSLYTSSWNTFSSDIVGKSFKISASKKVEKFNIFASYSKYNKRDEMDLIINYDLSLKESLKVVYTNTTYNKKTSNISGVELNYNYNF